MRIEIKRYKVLLLLSALLFFAFKPLHAQLGIDGSTCVKGSTSYLYMISGTYNSSWSITWIVNGGSIGGVHNGNKSGTIGGGLNGVTVTWDASGSGYIQFYCSGGSAMKNVTIAAPFAGGSITSGKTQTIPYNTVPATITCSAASGGTCTGAALTYQWQQSPDLTNWSNISGATALNYSPGALTTTTYFRRMATSPDLNNSSTYSDEASIFVNPTLSAGTISSPVSGSINYNTTPGTITGTAATGGNCSGSYSYQWEISSDGTSFTNAYQGTTQNYTPGVLTATSYYRRRVTCGSESMVSNTITITVAPRLTAGSITPASATIGYGATLGTLTYSGTSGGNCSGNYTLQWQSSADNSTWTDISGAGTSGYTAGTLTATTYYRVKVSCAGENAYSAVMTTTVLPPLNGGTIYADNLPPLLSYNTSPGVLHGTYPFNGNCNGNYQYQWESSSDGTTFGALSYGTSADYTTGNLIATAYYRRKVTCGSEVAYSNVLVIPVAQPLGGGTISSPVASVLYNSDPGTITGSPATNGNCSGNYTYSWESSTDNVNFTVVGSSGISFDPGLLSQTVFLRRKATCGAETAEFCGVSR